MKRIALITALILLAFQGKTIAQEYTSKKISTELQKEWDKDADDEMYRVVILMRDQLDAKQISGQTRHLNKAQKREYVMNELQRISKIGQKDLLNDLQHKQKGNLVEDIKTFWIFNGICCTTTKGIAQAIAERPDVAFISKEQMLYIMDDEVDGKTILEKQPATNNTWNVNKVNAPAVWNLGYTGKGVIVAIIDTGVNYNHTDIANNMWDGGEEFPHHGWDFINDDNDPMDDQGHGTHCTGIMSSYGTNGNQCGIAKDAKIMALKALRADNEGSPQSATWASIEFAVSHGADILSMSLGSSGMGGYWADRAVMENVLHCGVVAAVAACNDGNNPNFPAPFNVGSPGNCPSPWQHPDQTLGGGHTATVTVGSVDSNDTRAASSSYGPSTWAEGSYTGNYNDYPWIAGDVQNIGLIKPDIAAPGVSILSLDYATTDNYKTMGGTSMATPCVAGVMALMLEANPTLSPLEIDSIIETTAIACAGQTSKNNYYGSGRIDALAAINHILGVCAAPTNLRATVNGANVELQWDAANNVDTYRIYRNNVIIASSVSAATYTDESVPAGDIIYYVRSNGANGHASLPSNEVSVSIAPSFTPFHLIAKEINTTNRSIELQWNQLYYTDKSTIYYNLGERHIAAQKYPTSLLQPYAGMQIKRISFIGAHANSEFTISLYEGDAMTPGILVHSGSITTSEDNQKVDYVLSAPILINPNKTLWLTIETADMLMIGATQDNGNGDAFLLSFPSEPFWYFQAGYSWSFQIGLGSNDHTYKLYHNGTAITNNIAEANAIVQYSNGINRYQVSAYTNDYESPLSNSIYVIDGNAQINEIILDENDYLYGLSSSTLTVNGALVSTNPDHLILENGAQLINDSEGVKATVKKTIQPFTKDANDGWNLIASPVIGSLEAVDIQGLIKNEYDLYAFDQSGVDENNSPKEWRNYKANVFSVDHTTGYLYANSDKNTLSFAGTLAGSGSIATLTLDDNADFSGFNLIGNPYPCNVNTTKPFYVLQYNGDEDVTSFVLGSNPISPCEAILVQAQTDRETVSFSKVPVAEPSAIVMQLSGQKLRSNATLDEARISFEEQCQLTKYTWGKAASAIYIPQNGQNFAVAYANGQNEMPLNFKAAQNGTYTLNFETENLDLDYLHLIDNMTGADVDLLASPSYSFEGRANDYESRFKLVFSNYEDTVGDNAAFAYINDGNIIVTGVEDASNASLQVMDMMGRVFVSHSGGIQCIPTAGMTAGVYVLRLINGDSVKTQKIVIE